MDLYLNAGFGEPLGKETLDLIRSLGFVGVRQDIPNDDANAMRPLVREVADAGLIGIFLIGAEVVNGKAIGSAHVNEQPHVIIRRGEMLAHLMMEENASGVIEVVNEPDLSIYEGKPPEQRDYTWWTYRAGARERNVGWRIDYHFVNREFVGVLRSARILPEVLGSDHCPVVVDLKL